MILGMQRAMKEDGTGVSMSQLYHWFDVPRRTVYYKACKAPPKVQERFEKPIKEMIEQDPSFGYLTVAGLLNFNKSTVQRIFQIRGWQVKQRAIGFRPRVQAMPSVAQAPDERWATDLCRAWTGRDNWASLDVEQAAKRSSLVCSSAVTPSTPRSSRMHPKPRCKPLFAARSTPTA